MPGTGHATAFMTTSPYFTGGGGVGDALQRDPAEVAEDVRNGVVTATRASEEYGVAIDPESLEVDEHATARLRMARVTDSAEAARFVTG